MSAGQSTSIASRRPSRQRGFTLIELMIAVAIIAILASIAYPSYQRYVLEARRSDAHATLLNLASRLERCYTVSNTYQDCSSFPTASEEGFYTISAPTLGTAEFTLSAAAQGAQTADTACQTITLNQRGERGPDECW
ncbi:type IV pilin protein [Franzmannia pantelleriensis]|uniref:type IV pilin protein n=1 Tax=Franzmannia pantelleriensis TaxID=48727 RepID=UPI00248206B0|nr:type IV pilin protein [Halomonas pantelleriensis]